MHPARLAAKVEAINFAHDYAINLYKKLVEVFTPLIGQKVVRADGSLLVSVEKLLPTLPYNDDIRVTFDRHSETLAWHIHTEKVAAGAHEAHNMTLYVAFLTGQRLDKFHVPPTLRTDYTTQAITAGREKIKQLKEQLSRARKEIEPFGDDN